MKFMLIYRSHDLTANEIHTKAKVKYFEEMRIDDQNLFKIGTSLDFKWYNQSDKAFMKTKLGKMYYATMQKHSRDQQRNCVARFIDFERISTYVIESFDNRMVSLFQVTNIENLWL